MPSLPWDGTLGDLPSGWEDGFARGMTTERPHTSLMAIAISVAPSQHGRKLSSRMIQTFTDNARAAGLANGVIAPVRRTGMPFPEDGTYVFPGGLAPVTFVDGVGTHMEPNVWVHHPV